MTITLSLSDEQQDALNDLLARHNDGIPGGTITAEEFLTEVVTGLIDDHVRLLFNAAVSRLSDAAKAMSYPQRQALIAAVASHIPT